MSEVDAARAQLERYARDLRDAVLRESEASRALESAQAHLETFARDLRKSIDLEHDRVRQANADSASVLTELLVAATIEDAQELRRLSRGTRVLGGALGLGGDELEALVAAAPLHDLGMLALPHGLVARPGPLAEPERLALRSHPELGAAVLRVGHSALVRTAREVALSHHESWDGSGYPHGLSGERIPLAARIVKLADVYDALRSPRPHRAALNHQYASHAVLHGLDTLRPEHFDPDVLAAFAENQPAFAQIYEDTQPPSR